VFNKYLQQIHVLTGLIATLESKMVTQRFKDM